MSAGAGRQVFVLPAVFAVFEPLFFITVSKLLLKVLLFVLLGRVALPPGFFVPCRRGGCAEFAVYRQPRLQTAGLAGHWICRPQALQAADFAGHRVDRATGF